MVSHFEIFLVEISYWLAELGASILNIQITEIGGLILNKNLQNQKRDLFFSASGVIFAARPYFSKLSLAFELKKYLLGCQNIFILLYFLCSEILCYDAPKLLHKTGLKTPVFISYVLLCPKINSINFGAS